MYDIRTAILPFMFIFNTDILLLGVDSAPLAVYIFVMTCIGAFTFAAATQGWFATKNRWYDGVLLLTVSAVMFRPDFFSRVAGIENHYYAYLIGVALAAAIYMFQKMRGSSTPVAA